MKKTRSPIIICEGQQEIGVVKNICKNIDSDKNIFQLDASGNSKYITIAKKIFNHVKVLRENCSPIIVLFDRETRKESSEHIIQGVKSELRTLGLDVDRVIIGVADPYVESWILPFVDSDGNFPIDTKKGWDGKKCLGELKRRLEKKEIHYKKIQVGVRILSEIDPKKLADVSESFRNLYEQTREICNW